TGPDNITYSYRYDSGGKLQSISIPGEGSYTINQYKWNQIERVTLPGGAQIIIDYDGYMRGERIQALDPASNNILDTLYTFDPLDNIEVREALEARYDYGYDDVDRLTTADTTLSGQSTATNQSYGYDPVGNRDSYNQASWVYDDNDRLQQRGSITYEYDGNGSQTKETNSITTEVKNYIYNLENRLSEIRDGNNILIASYSYDPFGIRISKTVGSTTTYYYYSEDGLAAETDSNGTVTTSYHWQMNTPWGTDPMFIRQGGQYGYYVTDHLGTPQRIVGSNGAVIWSGGYDAFGGAEIGVASVVSNLRFPGQYFDFESGLHYNWFRYYEVGTGRYVSSDPIGLRGGVNVYGYVAGNPLVFTDSHGLWANVAVGVGIRIVGGRAAGAAISRGLQGVAGRAAGRLLSCLLIGYCNESADKDKEKEKSKESGGSCPAGTAPEDDYPEDPDDWTPPDGWEETPTGERTDGRHRQWKDENGDLRRRWDREGDPVSQPDMGPHWWDSRFPKKHIPPNR
ncbi:MAG: hypothetical protein GY820_14190, partial [Gammaproteobacteria bacterium]|nr:hypothetical protein [Gammaproteobacteria bacterium]